MIYLSLSKSKRQILLLSILFSVVCCLTTVHAKGNRANGARLYNQFCVPCHGKLGNGQGNRALIEGLNPPPRDHTNYTLMGSRSTKYLFTIIKFGGKDIRVSHIMPQWKHIFSDEEIIDIISHLRSLANSPTWQSQDGP